MSKTKKLIVAGLVAILVFAITVFVAGRANAKTLGTTWTHSKGHWPYIVVENHASSSYPVKTGVRHWGAPLHYGKCSSHPNAPCVKVFSHNDGANNNASAAAWSVWPGTHHFAVVEIHMNNYYGFARNYAYRLQAVKHELGHAMGLDHDNSGGVMQSGVDGQHTHANRYERQELRRLYGIRA